MTRCLKIPVPERATSARMRLCSPGDLRSTQLPFNFRCDFSDDRRGRLEVNFHQQPTSSRAIFAAFPRFTTTGSACSRNFRPATSDSVTPAAVQPRQSLRMRLPTTRQVRQPEWADCYFPTTGALTTGQRRRQIPTPSRTCTLPVRVFNRTSLVDAPIS